MKLPFRFYRGELNGYYILAFLLSRNDSIDDTLSELVYQASMLWALEGEVTADHSPIREEDLVNLAQFAGVIRPVQYIQSSVGSLRFTLSHIVNGAERSERALFNTVTEAFEFFHVDNDDYATDITDQATSTLRASFVPLDAVPVGYVAYGTDLYDAYGNVIPASILSSPPSGVPYDTYYGEKYLTLENTFTIDTIMSLDMFKRYYECIMRIKNTGASIAELLNLTSVLGEGYIIDLELVENSYYYTLRYSLNSASTIDNKGGRLNAWTDIVGKLYKDFVLVEREV